MAPKKSTARPMVALLIIALLASMGITASTEASAQVLPALSGRVTAGGVPLDGLVVGDIFGGAETTTDTNGDFSITVDDPEFAPLEVLGEQTADRPSIDLTSQGTPADIAYDAELPAIGTVELTFLRGPYGGCTYNEAVVDGCVLDEFCTAELASDGLCDELRIEVNSHLEIPGDNWIGSASTKGETVDRSVTLPVFAVDEIGRSTITAHAIDGSSFTIDYRGGPSQIIDLGEDVRTRVTGTITAGGVPVPGLRIRGAEESVSAADGSFSYSETKPAPFNVQLGGSIDRPQGGISSIEVATAIVDPATELPVAIELPAIIDLEVVYICPGEDCGTDHLRLHSELQGVFDGVELHARSGTFGAGYVIPVFATPNEITIRDATTTLLTIPWDGVSNPLVVELAESEIVTVAGVITAGGNPIAGVGVDDFITAEDGRYEFQTLRSPVQQTLAVGQNDVNPLFFLFVDYSHGDDERVEVDVDLPAIVELEVQLQPACGYAEAIVAGCALDGDHFVSIYGGIPELVDGDFGAWSAEGTTTGESLVLEVFDVSESSIVVFGKGGVSETSWDGSNPFIIEVDGVVAPPEPQEVSGTILAGGVPVPGIAVGRDVTDEFGRFTTIAEGELQLYPTEVAIVPDFDLIVPVPEEGELTIELPEVIDLRVEVNTTCLYNRAIIDGCADTGTAALFSIEIRGDLSSNGGSGSWTIFDGVIDGKFRTLAFTSDFTVIVGESEGDVQTALPWDGTNPFVIDPVEISGVVQTEDGVPVSGIHLVGPSLFDPVVSDDDGLFTTLVPPGLSELGVGIANPDLERRDVPGFSVFGDYRMPADGRLEVVLPRILPLEVRVNDPARPAYRDIEGEFEVFSSSFIGRFDLGFDEGGDWEYRGVTTDGVFVAPAFDTGFSSPARARSLEDASIVGNSTSASADQEFLQFVDVTGAPYIYYRDRDRDLYGNPDEPLHRFVSRPTQPYGYAVASGDCDDSNASINPGAAETPGNGVDENCDGFDGDVVAMCLGSAVTIDMRLPGVTGIGTDGDDVILGTSGPDVIRSAGGDDKICAGGGDDLINAGTGDDTVAAGAGNDRIFGLSGADDLRGWTGKDFIRGGSGPDLISGGPDDDNVWGQAGGDVVRGGAGDDIVRGNRGADTVNGDAGDDLVAGGPDADIVRGGPGDDTMVFEPGIDIIVNGGAGNNTPIPE